MFRTLTDLQKRTIGIADGGNEIGCGKIWHIISKTIGEYNYVERTDCGRGMFSIVPTDVLVISTSSNLGCTGIIAALSLLKSDLNLCHTPELKRQIIKKGAEFGLTDGGFGKVIEAVDGVAAKIHTNLVSIIEAVVVRGSTTAKEREF